MLQLRTNGIRLLASASALAFILTVAPVDVQYTIEDGITIDLQKAEAKKGGKDDGGQDAVTMLMGSDGNTITVGQSGSGNVSFVALANAASNVVGHDQSGAGAAASTFITGSMANGIAVVQSAH